MMKKGLSGRRLQKTAEGGRHRRSTTSNATLLCWDAFYLEVGRSAIVPNHKKLHQTKQKPPMPNAHRRKQDNKGFSADGRVVTRRGPRISPKDEVEKAEAKMWKAAPTKEPEFQDHKGILHSLLSAIRGLAKSEQRMPRLPRRKGSDTYLLVVSQLGWLRLVAAQPSARQSDKLHTFSNDPQTLSPKHG